jgi:hypothetical protein
MGEVYYDMGFLSSTEVVECSASDLVGQYVGQTGPKTKALLEKSLGRVLFIDEAYRLSEGHFAKEAMDELVGLLTQEAFQGKLVVILAGYDQEINELLSVNPSLGSRFRDEIVFKHLSPAQCLDVLMRKLSKESIHLDVLDDTSSAAYLKMTSILEELSELSSWGNARDVETLAKRMTRIVFTTPSSADPSLDWLTIPADQAVQCLETMLTEQKERSVNVPTRSHPATGMPRTLFQQPPEPPRSDVATTTKVIQEASYAAADEDEVRTQDGMECVSQGQHERDYGVTDEVWYQLQEDKRAAEEAKREGLEREESLQKEVNEPNRREEEAQAEASKQVHPNNTGEEDELMKQRELARLERIRRLEEARIQQKLREMGVCVAGYKWVKQASGYRCEGGSHFISNQQLGI